MYSESRIYRKNPNYWYKGKLQPNRIKLTFAPGMKSTSAKKVTLIFDLYIASLVKTSIQPKELVFVPELPPVETPSLMTNYLKMDGPVFEISRSFK